MRAITTCNNPKFDALVIECNHAAMAHKYPNEYVNEQFRELKSEQINSPAVRQYRTGKRKI